MYEIPDYVFDPIRKSATLATNTRSGRPLVEIRCDIPFGAEVCGRPLGGAWVTSTGVVVIVNRLRPRDSVRAYLRLASRPDERMRTWIEEGAFPEEPVLFEVDGTWHRVPGPEGVPTVRCPRRGHGPRVLDLDAVIAKVGLARATETRQTMGASASRSNSA